jgi:hypothetical protein
MGPLLLRAWCPIDNNPTMQTDIVLLLSQCYVIYTCIIAGTFWLYAILATLGAIFLALFLPETKGKSLEEVEVLFPQPWCGSTEAQPTVVPYSEKTVQYVLISGVNRDGRDSELDSPDES